MIIGLKVSKSTCCFETTLDLVNGVSVENVLFMAYTELVEVNEPDIVSLKRFSNNIRFYNGSNDPWCPLEYVHSLKQKVPELYVEVCKANIPHAFVLGRANDVANIISNWYEKDASSL